MPMPEKQSIVALDDFFDEQIMEVIKTGFCPGDMSDKWFAYWEHDRLYLHRSWTGVCVYVVTFKPEASGYRMVEVQINRDAKQYGEVDDERDVKLLKFLLGSLFGIGNNEYPLRTDLPEEERWMEAWSAVGRSILNMPVAWFFT